MTLGAAEKRRFRGAQVLRHFKKKGLRWGNRPFRWAFKAWTGPKELCHPGARGA